jgi:hypothetical protein
MTSDDSDRSIPPKEATSAVYPFHGAPLSLTVEMMSAFAATQMRLFGSYLGMVRNFHQVGAIPSRERAGLGVASVEERASVVEIERDGKVGIDLKFGTITFEKEEAASYAVALVDVIVGTSAGSGTRVQMEIKVPADVEVDSVVGVTEKCRAHIVGTLRAAADTFDATTAQALLFHGGVEVR